MKFRILVLKLLVGIMYLLQDIRAGHSTDDFSKAEKRLLDEACDYIDELRKQKKQQQIRKYFRDHNSTQ